MGYISLKQTVDVMAQKIGSVVDVAQSGVNITEGVNEWPMVKVYPNSGANVSSQSRNMEGATFRSSTQHPFRIHEWNIRADYYAFPRKDTGTEIEKVTGILDSLLDMLDNELQANSFFGLEGVHGMAYEWEYVTLSAGDQMFSGIRLDVVLTIY